MVWMGVGMASNSLIWRKIHIELVHPIHRLLAVKYIVVPEKIVL